MKYRIELKAKAIRDLEAFTTEDRGRLISKIESLQNNLAGDVKRLTNFTPEFRLRVGNYGILFEVDADRVISIV